MEQWKINRAGLINFWYYDEAEFQFIDGRMLLKGANGSGKSVTMQSLLPLLFDGNKSPERLDPFGSRARKMESYLLSEGLNLEERTGYLYLEFTKPETGRFVTIGMGMRARKNMPLNTWYFIVRDNSRIGKDLDFQLYRDIGEKIPLTERELKNKLGELNSVYNSQKEYKSAVNQALFGFSDLMDFDELIELLIQIRSPKLSKEFKPTTMYEIMQNSLITLADDDLRPMSEAIEYMDEVKLKVETLEESKKGLAKIAAFYDRYNTHWLALKARNYLNAEDAFENTKNTLYILEEELKEKGEEKNCKESEKANLEIEWEGLRDEEDSLASHDIIRLTEEKVELEKEGRGLSMALEDRIKKQDKDKEKMRSLGDEIRYRHQTVQSLKDKIDKHLKEMEYSSLEAAFDDEHGFFLDDYIKDQEDFRFELLDDRIKKYDENLSFGQGLLSEYEGLILDHQNMQKEIETIKQHKEKNERETKELERLLYEIQAEFAEKMIFWDKQNLLLKVEGSSLEMAAGRALQYGNPFSYSDIKEPILEVYNRLAAQQEVRMRYLKEELESAKDHLNEKKEAKERLVKAKDPEFLREDKAEKNRRILKEAGIPHMPLYMLLEFGNQCPDKLKDTIEEALFDLGILDALVIDPKLKDKAMAIAQKGAGDKYIFANPDYFSHDISEYLKAEIEDELIPQSIVEEILKSIWLVDDENRLFISEDGFYGLGIIRGRTSGEYKSRYLGRAARKRHKEELIAKLEEEIDETKETIKNLENELEDNIKSKEKAWEELAQFPGEDDLKVAFSEHRLATEEGQRIGRDLKILMEKSEEKYQSVNEKNIEISQKLRRIHLPATSKAYGQARYYLSDYKDVLNNLKRDHDKKISEKVFIYSLESQAEDLSERISDAIDEIGRTERELRKTLARLDDVIQQLSLSENAEIIERIEYVKKRLSEIPGEISRLSELLGSLGNQIDNLEERKKEEAKNKENCRIKADIFAGIFESEYELAYVEKIIEKTGEQEADKNKADISTARRILSNHGQLLEEKKTLAKRGEELQEVFNYQSGILLEYNMKRVDLFSQLLDWDRLDWHGIGLNFEELLSQTQRMDIRGKFAGKELKFYQLADIIDEQISENKFILNEQDRRLFEDILINSISRKIRSKIEHSKRWVDLINKLMQNMNTSSSINFSLSWTERRAESEDQLGTKELVDILRTDQKLLTQEHKNKMMNHFRSKIRESKLRMDDESDSRSFLTIMKEILDYRQWFEFKLFYHKSGVGRKEMTNTAFYTFSGGEKAMAMYIPLFAAVYAKYQGGADDCPMIVSLDEAFAGVDENNINDMFKLMVELNLSFIANSQVLFGDYQSVPGLAIYELIRPENLTYVTVIPYRWNGKSRELIVE